MDYLPVIGLEIHLQVKTESKMFCRCSTDYFQKPPNTHVCEVCFGLPGALPKPNRAAIEKCIKLALALNCKITDKSKFDRKNYYYPDLPKGYQISQFDQPIGREGFLEVEIGDDARRIRINRVHIEEDTAKSLHSEQEDSLIDYNKSGIPLIEMVTEPDFESVEEVLAFAKRLRQIVRYADISDAEMQKGQMRFELNMSLKTPGAKELPSYKIEVKNIGSISVLEKVISFEIERQSKLLKSGKSIKTQTRGLKDMSGETLFQRAKESADDYRYFPEPDIAPFKVNAELVEELKNTMPELPGERKQRYIKLGLEPDQAEIFLEDSARGNYFDEVLNQYENSDINFESSAKEISNWINSEIMGTMEKNKLSMDENPILPEDLLQLIYLTNKNKITRSVGKKVVLEIFQTGKTAMEIIDKKGLLQEINDDEIDEFINQVIVENEKVVADLEKNPNAIKFLVGQVMKISKGKVNPNIAEEKLKGKLFQ